MLDPRANEVHDLVRLPVLRRELGVIGELGLSGRERLVGAGRVGVLVVSVVAAVVATGRLALAVAAPILGFAVVVVAATLGCLVGVGRR